MKSIQKPLLNCGFVLITLLLNPVFADSVDDGGYSETLLVTATRLPRQIEDVAGTITLIDKEELEKQMAVNFNDIVRYEPGLSMSTAKRGGNQGFIIRGMNGKRVLMLMDGIKSSDVYSAGPSAYGNDSYELDDLKSIEVIRGPASALYGADALGGVVLLKSKDPADYVIDDQNLYLRLNAIGSSASDLQKLGATFAGANDSWGYLLQANHKQFNEFDVKGSGSQVPQDGESTAALFKLVYRPDENNQLTLTADTYAEEIEYQLTAADTPELPRSGLDDTDRNRFSMTHSWSGESSIVDKIDTSVYYQQADAVQNTQEIRPSSFSFPHAPFGNRTNTQRVTDFEFNQRIKGISSTWYKTVESGTVINSLVYGINYEVVSTERPRYRCETELSSGEVICAIRAYPGAPPEVFPNKTFPDTETTLTGIYLQDEMVFGESGFTLIPGIRYDQIDMEADEQGVQPIIDMGYEIKSADNSEVSKNLGLIYELFEDTAIFLQYAEGFRAPSYDEANLSYINLAYRYGVVPNPDLKPEKSQGYELGIKSRQQDSFFTFAIYDNHYKDFINSSFVGEQRGVRLYQDSNLGKVRISGAELSGFWQLSPRFGLRNSIAWSKGKDEETHENLNHIDPLSAVVAMVFESGDGSWGFETIATLVDKKDKVKDDESITAAGYGLLDLTAFYNYSSDLKLRVGAFNLLDKEYARWANIQGLDKDSSSIENLKEPGTEFRLALTWSL